MLARITLSLTPKQAFDRSVEPSRNLNTTSLSMQQGLVFRLILVLSSL
jgi:hypothetical protein